MSKLGGKEGFCFENVKFMELGFLNTQNGGGSRLNSITNNRALFRVAKTAHIPG